MALDERLEYARESALRRASNLAFFIDSRAKLGDGFSEEAYKIERDNLEQVAGISFDELMREYRIRQAGLFASGIIAAQPEHPTRRYFLSTTTKAMLGYLAGGSRALSVLSSSAIAELLAFQRACGGQNSGPSPMPPNPNPIPPIPATEPVASTNSIVNLFDATEMVPSGALYVLDAPVRPLEIPIINGTITIDRGMNLIPGTYRMILDSNRFGIRRGFDETGFEAVVSAAGIAVDTKDGRYETPLNVMKLSGNKLGTGDINRDIDLDMFIDAFLRSTDPREPRHSQRHMERLELVISQNHSYRANDNYTRIQSVISPFAFNAQSWANLVNSMRRDYPLYSDGFYPPENLPSGTLPTYVKVISDLAETNPRTNRRGLYFLLDNIPRGWAIALGYPGTDRIRYFFFGIHPTAVVREADYAHDNRESLGVAQRDGLGIDERTGISDPRMKNGARGLYGREERLTIDKRGFPTEGILPVTPLPAPMAAGASYNDTFRIYLRSKNN